MLHKRLFPMALFLLAALLSAYISPKLGLEHSKTALGVPESTLAGGMVGRTWLRSGDALDMSVSATPGVHEVKWTLDGRTVGISNTIHLLHLGDGEYFLRLTYRDYQDRLYNSTALIRVLDPDTYAMQTASLQAVISMLLWEEDSQIYLPAILR